MWCVLPAYLLLLGNPPPGNWLLGHPSDYLAGGSQRGGGQREVVRESYLTKVVIPRSQVTTSGGRAKLALFWVSLSGSLQQLYIMLSNTLSENFHLCNQMVYSQANQEKSILTQHFPLELYFPGSCILDFLTDLAFGKNSRLGTTELAPL